MSPSNSTKTHRHVKKPKISARFLADYMAASEQKKRSIITDCKYRTIARIIQHDDAKLAIAKFLREENPDVAQLLSKAKDIREKFTTDEFEQQVNDHNADYIERFASVYPSVQIPPVDLLPAGTTPEITLHGVTVTNEICLRLRRTTKSNKVCVGIAALRYAKGKALSPEVASWQSAFLFGYLNNLGSTDGEEPEQKLCLTIDAYTGTAYPAPSDSRTRFKNMEAACATIAERWENVPIPAKAVI